MALGPAGRFLVFVFFSRVLGLLGLFCFVFFFFFFGGGGGGGWGFWDLRLWGFWSSFFFFFWGGGGGGFRVSWVYRLYRVYGVHRGLGSRVY